MELQVNGWCETRTHITRPTVAPQPSPITHEARPYPTRAPATRPPTMRTVRPTTSSETSHTHGPVFEITSDPIFKLSSRVVKYGEICTPVDDCSLGSECIKGKCECPKTTHLQNGECVRDRRQDVSYPGDSCAMGQLCTGGSICDNDSRKCICAAGHIKHGKRCNSKDAPRFSAPGERCVRDENCAGGSDCVRGVCKCDDLHYASNGYCRPIDSKTSDVRLDGNGLRFSSKVIPPRRMAQPCNTARCKLPDCFCSQNGRQPPGNLRPDQVPQFVVLTFDDAVNGRTLPSYKEFFEEPRWKNPNGCPIKATFFVSHEWTNYDGVQWIYQKGHELASNSITHVNLADSSSQKWLGEMDGQRRIMAKFSGADESEIVGMRAPQLSLGSDAQFEMMIRSGFLYDNTMTANPGVSGAPFWPQTLDYKLSFPCNDNNCPTKSFPGVWEIPVNQFYGTLHPEMDSQIRASMLRAAVGLNETAEQLLDILLANFDRAYYTNRAPYLLTLNADFLQLNGKNTGMEALERFMDEITAENKDVYFVTMSQLINWMQHPTPLDAADRSAALRCNQSFGRQRGTHGSCAKPNKCMYRTPQLNSPEHQFLTCSPCPEIYPWIENPVGTI